MRKTTQSVEYTVEGPNEYGHYRLSYLSYESMWGSPEGFNLALREAIKKHIASAPKVVEFEGYLIAPHSIMNGYAVWVGLTDRTDAEEGFAGLISAGSAEGAYQQIASFATSENGNRKYIAPLLALAHFFEEGLHND